MKSQRYSLVIVLTSKHLKVFKQGISLRKSFTQKVPLNYLFEL